MKQKYTEIFMKILRVLLPAGAFCLGLLEGSYAMPVKETAESAEILYKIKTNFFDVRVFDSGNWCPMICMVLLIATVAVAIYCCFRESEESLVWLARLGSFALIACLGSILFIFELTIISWCMAGILSAMIAIAAVQEMKMEDARKK